MARLFDKVDQALPDSLLIAWDGCHKIYLAMDDVEAAWFKEHYTYTVEGDVETKSAAIHEWW